MVTFDQKFAIVREIEATRPPLSKPQVAEIVRRHTSYTLSEADAAAERIVAALDYARPTPLAPLSEIR